MPEDTIKINILADIQNAVAGFANTAISMAAVYMSMRKLVDLGKEMVKLAINEEQAQVRLGAAMKMTGQYSAIALRNMQDYALGLMKITTYDDEATESAASLLMMIGRLTTEGIKEAMPLLMDYASAIGTDLVSAAQAFADAIAGGRNMFQKYGISVKEATTPTERFKELIVGLTKTFGGFEEQMAKTTGGQIKSFGNQMQELGAQLGGLLTGVIGPTVGKLTAYLKDVNQMNELLGVGGKPGVVQALLAMPYGEGRDVGGKPPVAVPYEEVEDLQAIALKYLDALRIMQGKYELPPDINTQVDKAAAQLVEYYKRVSAKLKTMVKPPGGAVGPLLPTPLTVADLVGGEPSYPEYGGPMAAAQWNAKQTYVERLGKYKSGVIKESMGTGAWKGMPITGEKGRGLQGMPEETANWGRLIDYAQKYLDAAAKAKGATKMGPYEAENKAWGDLISYAEKYIKTLTQPVAMGIKTPVEMEKEWKSLLPFAEKYADAMVKAGQALATGDWKGFAASMVQEITKVIVAWALAAAGSAYAKGDYLGSLFWLGVAGVTAFGGAFTSAGMTSGGHAGGASGGSNAPQTINLVPMAAGKPEERISIVVHGWVGSEDALASVVAKRLGR